MFSSRLTFYVVISVFNFNFANNFNFGSHPIHLVLIFPFSKPPVAAKLITLSFPYVPALILNLVSITGILTYVDNLIQNFIICKICEGTFQAQCGSISPLGSASRAAEWRHYSVQQAKIETICTLRMVTIFVKVQYNVVIELFSIVWVSSSWHFSQGTWHTSNHYSHERSW